MQSLPDIVKTDSQPLLETAPTQQPDTDSTGQVPTLSNQPQAPSPLSTPGNLLLETTGKETGSTENIITPVGRDNAVDQTRYPEKFELKNLSKNEIKKQIYDAVTHGDLDKLKYLIKAGGNINKPYTRDTQSDRKAFLTHIAVLKNQPHVLKFLLENGACTAAIGGLISGGKDTLEYASIANDPVMVRIIIENELKSFCSKSRLQTLFLKSVQHGLSDLIICLEERGAKKDNFSDDGWKMPHAAAAGGQTQILIDLQRDGSDIFIKTLTRDPDGCEYDGDTPLEIAATYKKIDTVRWLISQGALRSVDPNKIDKFLMECLYLAVSSNSMELANNLIESWTDSEITSQGFTALAQSIKALVAAKSQQKSSDCELSNDVPLEQRSRNSTFVENLAKIINLVVPLSDMAEKIDGKTPITLAAEHSLTSVIIPIMRATLQHPQANRLLEEAHRSTDNLFIKDLLGRVALDASVLDLEKTQNKKNNTLNNVSFKSFCVQKKIAQQLVDLDSINDLLGRPPLGMTHLQKEAAKQGIFAELIQWRMNLVDSSKLFNNGEEDFPQDLVESLTNSAINEIDNLINQGNQWEEKQLKPIVNRLFNICCDLMKNGMQPSALPDVIAGLGFYQPIAQGIAEAWMSVYAAHTKSSNSSSRELSDQEVRDLEKKFRIELKSRLDSMSGALLRIDNANIPIESQHLYTDLMARQLALIAPLWRISD